MARWSLKAFPELSPRAKRITVLSTVGLVLLSGMLIIVWPKNSNPEQLPSAIKDTPQIKILNTERLDDFTIASLSNSLEQQQQLLRQQQQQINNILSQLQHLTATPQTAIASTEVPQGLQMTDQKLWNELWDKMGSLTPEEQCALYSEFITEYPHLRNESFEQVIRFNYEEWHNGKRVADANNTMPSSNDPLADYAIPSPIPTEYDYDPPIATPDPTPYYPPYQQNYVPDPEPQLTIRSFSSSKAETPALNLPAGSVFTGTIVTGVDAPTTDGAKADPYPVLVRLDNLDFLPNSYRSNLDSCFMLLSSYGDISSSRVLMRMQTLSCVNTAGYIVEGEVKGYAVGNDGKIGIAGRLVSKQGSVIAKTLTIGFLQGVGDVLNRPNIILPGVGSVGEKASTGEAMTAAVLGSTGKAIDKVASFYMNLANRMFPMVEVQAGTKIDLVLTSPVALQASERKVSAQPLQAQSKTPTTNPRPSAPGLQTIRTHVAEGNNQQYPTYVENE